VELPGFQMHSFPMNPSVFYAFRDLSFKTKNFERPIVITAELLIREEPERVLIKQGNARLPDFMIVSRPTDGFMKATLKSAEEILRKVLFSAPAGDSISGGGRSISEIGSIFSALPLPESDLSFRLPVVLSENIQFENNMASVYPVEKAIFELKPQKFGFIFSTRKGLKNLVDEIEEKLKTGFSGVQKKKP